MGDTSSFPLLIDIAAAAKLTGTSVGTLRRWVADGLPYVRAGAGGKKLFDPGDLRKWIETQKEAVGRAA
jgi:excisionase family DNA binding protein